MDAQALIAVVALLAVVAAAVVVVVVLERRRREAVPPLDQAEVVRQAVADALGSLRADTGEHVQQAVHTLMALAGDTLDGRLQAGQTHIDHRNEQISAQLEGLQAELRRVNTTVETLQREKAEQHGALVSGLEETIRQSQSVARTTQSLREALSSTKARGQWGERLADDVLRLAGFVEGVSYRRQVATSVGSVPDFTFPLPGGLVLHMDVKFPFDNYVRYLEAGGGADGQPQLNQFLRDARSRVKELGGRGYIRPGETLDYVLLFIPNEAVYGFLHEHNPALADFALGQ
ncbi:MAG: DNA recombination protein RmuC, partial [Acidimicrobiia bacterium]|nr:DNA recombination protein RmuC [Acidimicrobiia bacterium]